MYVSPYSQSTKIDKFSTYESISLALLDNSMIFIQNYYNNFKVLGPFRNASFLDIWSGALEVEQKILGPSRS